jgi:predicted GIY-YIG superfamily endonuclease
MFYVYLLRSLNYNQTYVGFSRDVQIRLNHHNEGKSPHTSKYKPWKLVTYFGFESESRAREFEKYLKTGSGIAFARRHLF